MIKNMTVKIVSESSGRFVKKKKKATVTEEHVS